MIHLQSSHTGADVMTALLEDDEELAYAMEWFSVNAEPKEVANSILGHLTATQALHVAEHFEEIAELLHNEESTL